ncbi:MAG: hypothetical protein EOP45_04805 [Sphingobacteriaceae bacterium]|nr:MAG: hypothetical protein EOP45_04805 [Sphingobacteriaceae bacterium]
MKRFSFIVLALINYFNCFAQNEHLFFIKEVFVTDSLQKKTVADFQRGDSNFFEDDNYIVNKTCSGEFGGTVKFKNKKTGVVYSCSATCPVVVNKVEGKYIVTNTLAHLIGFSEVIEIDNPDSMSIFKLSKPRKKIGKTVIRYVGDDESKSTIGTKRLVDSIGVLTLASFPYKKELFYIVTDFKKTFVSKIENKKFITVDSVSNESIWTSNPEIIKTHDGHYVVFFDNQKVNGYLDIFDNEIKLMRFK